MAILGKRIDLRKCKKEQLGALLLGQFLETGLLILALEPVEEDWLRKMFGATVTALHKAFVETAIKCGFESPMEDWNFPGHDKLYIVYDPGRIQSMPTL